MASEHDRVSSFFLFTTGIAICLAIGYVIPWGGTGSAAPRRVDALIAEMADPASRTQAYLRLRDQGAAAAPALLEAAQDPTYAARAEAVELLGRARSQEALPFLVGLTEPSLADARLGALGQIRGERALAAVVAALDQQERPELYFPALRALSAWPDLAQEVVAQRIVPFLGHAEWGLRELAARGVGEHRHAPAVATLIGLLRDDEPQVRQTAAWALMQIGEPRGRAAVDEALKSGAVVSEE